MEIKELENKHQDEKIIFIAGSGPSLHFINSFLDRIQKHVVIAVNSSIVKLPFANYFLSDDIGASSWSYYRYDAKELKCIKLLYREKLQKKVGHFNRGEVCWFNHKWWYSPKDKKYNLDGLVMTKDANAPIIGARTSLASALHFAYIMGGEQTKIVMLGCDCCYMGNRRYFWQFPGEPKVFRVTGEPVFSKPNKGSRKGRPVDSHSLDFIDYWNQLAIQTKKQNIDIIDASAGILEAFPKMSLEDVLEKYGDKNDK